jgi:poly(hydroxyalkanoate) granule-associated protein
MTKNTNNDVADKNDTKDQVGDGNADLVKQIKASAKEIWLAGLGAFNQKQGASDAEGEDTAHTLYQQLVKEGRDIERVSRSQLDRNIQNVKTLAFGSVDQVKEKAAGSLNRLESVFDERVSKALNRLGLTTSNDYNVLESRLEHAEQLIADLEGVVNSLKQEIEKSKATKSKAKPAPQ